jgi:hypothetical protein
MMIHIVAFLMLVDLQWSSNHVAIVAVFLPTLPSALLSYVLPMIKLSKVI